VSIECGPHGCESLFEGLEKLGTVTL